MLLVHARVLAPESVYRSSEPTTKYAKTAVFTPEQLKFEDWEPCYPCPEKAAGGDCGCGEKPEKK